MSTKNTLLLTSKGYLTLGELENQQVEVWNGQEFTKTVVIKTGKDVPIRTVTFDSGASAELSINHQVYLFDNYVVTTHITKKVSEIDVKDKLIKGVFPILEFGTKEFPFAYTNGFYTGAERYHRVRNYAVSRAAIFSSRHVCLEYLEIDKKLTDRNSLIFSPDVVEMYQIPFDAEYSLETRLDWLAGLFDGGLIKRKVKPRPIWDIYSKNENFLREMKLFMQMLGGDARVTKNEDLARAPYSLRVAGVTMQNIRKLGLPAHSTSIPEIKLKNRGYTMPKIASVVDEGVVADTYGFIEPNRRAGVFNGILLGDGYSK